MYLDNAISYFQGAPKVREANGLTGRPSMLNERSGQLYKAVRYKLTGQLKREARIGLKTWMIWHYNKICTDEFGVLWCSRF